MKRASVLLLGALAAALASCSDLVTGSGGPTTVALRVDRTVGVVGEPFTFRFEAAGSSLVRVVLSYGDGAADTLLTFGSVTAASSRTHAYTAPGRYTAEVRAEDALSRTATDSVHVQVEEGPGG